MKSSILSALVVAGLAALLSESVSAQQPGAPEQAPQAEAPDVLPGPPQWVREAWEAGLGAELPGAPDWVSRLRQRRQARRPAGPPRWVIEAWRNGRGFELPGAGRRGGPPASQNR